MDEILWHRRETRRQTEKTNLILQPGKSPAYSNSLVRRSLLKLHRRDYIWRAEPLPSMVRPKFSGKKRAKSTGETPRGRGPSNYTKIVEIMSGKTISQQGLATTCKDLLRKVNSEVVRGLWFGA